MYARTYGETTCGVNGEQIIVEVDIANGLPAFEIVGLPDTAIKESRERVRAALKNSGFRFPTTRITVNLAPADLKKDGSGLDVPIAIGILCSSGQLAAEEIEERIFVGELALDGGIRGVTGVLPMI
ncbi:MAG: magnesium chelatase domain-containing protein, partial [Acidaminococcaceae bacterium]